VLAAELAGMQLAIDWQAARMGRSLVPLLGLDRPFCIASPLRGWPLDGCHIKVPDRTFLRCTGSARRLKEVMHERVRADEGVRLARPRVQRLSAAMERQATALLAALLADAAKRHERPTSECGVPIGGPVGGPIGTPIATPKNRPPGPGGYQ
jgi:hypothetical protein